MKAMTRQSRRGLAMFLALAFLLSAALVLAPRAEAVGPATYTGPTALDEGVSFSGAVNPGAYIGPLNFAVTLGTLPMGVSLNSTSGVISGTPALGSSAGYYVEVTVTDSDSSTALAAFTLNVAAAPAISFGPILFPPGQVGQPYNSMAAPGSLVGAVPPVIFTASGLPDGLNINSSSGEVNGTPTRADTFSTIMITATDGLGRSINSSLSTIIIASGLYLTPGTPPTGTVGSSYSFRPTVIGGSASTRFELLSSLAPGLGFDTATGTISGTPTGTFDADVTIRAVDGAATSTQSYRIKINPSGGSTGGYKITTGDGSRYVGGSSLSFTANIPVSRFQALKVNGNTLSTSNYSYSGTTTSTTATLNKAYLDSLASGSRSISFVASDGSASGSFSVGSEPNYRPPTYPSYPSTPGRYPTVVGNTGGGGKAPTVIMKVEVEEASIEWKVVD